MPRKPKNTVEKPVKKAATKAAKKPVEKLVGAAKRGRPSKPQAPIEFKEGLSDVDKIATVPIADLDLADRRFQYRLKEKTADITASLIKEGQLVPIILWGKEAPYKLVDGYRRAAAVTSLGWPSVKAIIRENLTEDDAYRLSFLENVKRKSFGPLDMANAIWKSMVRGLTTPQIIDQLQISERSYRRYKQLLAFADAITTALERGEISMSHAQLLNNFKLDDLAAWIEKIKTEHLSLRELKKALIKAVPKKTKTKKFFRKDKDRFRFYPFRFSAATPKYEADRIIAALKEALALAEKIRAAK